MNALCDLKINTLKPGVNIQRGEYRYIYPHILGYIEFQTFRSLISIERYFLCCQKKKKKKNILPWKRYNPPQKATTTHPTRVRFVVDSMQERLQRTGEFLEDSPPSCLATMGVPWKGLLTTRGFVSG